MKKEEIKNLPTSSGVYIFKDDSGKVIYVGKAANLKRRVSSYFHGKRDIKTAKLSQQVSSISFKKTDTVIEALIKEAQLIKEWKPAYNIKGKDDSSFLYVVITDEEYPRVLLRRGKEILEKERVAFGPFVSSSNIRDALSIIRKIFPFHTHSQRELNRGKACLYYEIGLCPGTCVGGVDKKQYKKDIKNIELFFKGGKNRIISNLKKEMAEESKKLNFERAEKIKRKIFAIEHIRDTAISLQNESKKGDKRIEGYDISNISGTFAVGSMVVFRGNIADKKEYRKFKIRSVVGGDTDMIREVLERRFKNSWPLPHLIVIDGGVGQVNTVKEVLKENGLSIPVIGIAKGKDRKGNRLVGKLISGVTKETLLKIRDEAHRFAIKYHRKLIRKIS